MQTLHLRFRDLRAILLGKTPSRWPTPSLRTATTWETASPLPNPLRPTLAVGAHPETSHQRLDRCPTLGAGLTMASSFREPRIVGPVGANTSRVCWSQTVENNPHPLHEPNRPPDDLQGARLPHQMAGQVLTSTRKLEAEGFAAKTRVLDSARTGGVEIEQMRGVWAELQNRALERAGEVDRVDHRSLEKQRETALDRGDTLSADELDRDPELKLGPAANSMERREKAAAEREGREYVPLTERGAVTHAARQARMAFQDMRERLDVARETYGMARDEGQGRVSAGLAALRAATSKEHGARTGLEDVRERLERITQRDGPEAGEQSDVEPGNLRAVNDRLREALDRDRGDSGAGVSEGDGKRSIRERLDDVLNKPRERLELEDEPEKDREVENEREIDRGPTHGL